MTTTLSHELSVPDEIEPYEVSSSVLERQKKLEDSIAALNMISRLAGRDIDIHKSTNASEIPADPGIYVLENMVADGVDVVDTDFKISPVLLSGIADSAHAVVTGKLGIQFSDGSSKEVEVAAKRSAKREFQDRFDRTIREAQVMEEIVSNGDIGFMPVAVVVAPDRHPLIGEVILISIFSPDVVSLDNHPWGRGPDRRNLEIAREAAEAVARFNIDYKRVHGDAKIKNVVVEEGNGFGMIDFETSSQTIDLNSPEDCSTAAWKDFGALLDSFEKKGFFEKVKARNELSAVLDTIAESYLRPWESNGNPEVHSRVVDSVTHECSRLIEKRFPRQS